MAQFDPEYFEDLKARFKQVTELDVGNQAEQFKLRYILKIGEDCLAVDDRANMFLSYLSNQQYFVTNDPNLNKFLEDCQVHFESVLTRNQEYSKLSPLPSFQRLSFIEFILHEYKDQILDDFFKRWKLSGRAKKSVKKNNNHMAMAIYSEFLDQPPFGIDAELDKLTKEERELMVNHNTRVTNLQTIVHSAKEKQVPSVSDKRAMAELQMLRQTDVKQKLNIIRANIKKRRNKVMARQREAMTQLIETGRLDLDGNLDTGVQSPQQQVSKQNQNQVPQQQAQQQNYTPPPGWTEYLDENTGAYYYYNEASGATQWERP